MHDVTYTDAVARVVAIVKDHPEDLLTATVPACPDWTMRDLLAHLAGVGSDVLAGRTDGFLSSAWSDRQVAERRSIRVDAILDELVTNAGAVGAQAVSVSGPNPAWDLIIHEGDLRELLGLAVPPEQAWLPVLRGALDFAFARGRRPGSLIVNTDDGRQWIWGTGDPRVTVGVAPYELLRGLFSRRSRAQLEKWDWQGQPASYLAEFPFFGERSDDQPLSNLRGLVS